MAGEQLEAYFRQQQVAPQWLPVLRAMALELSTYSDPHSLRRLFFDIGRRFAADVGPEFDQVDTVDHLQQGLNRFWSSRNWGWVTMTEVSEGIEIVHEAAPLAEAFGDDALEWSVGLLEGFYQQVFAVLGADEKMMVRSLDGGPRGLAVHLRFGY